MLLTTRHSVYIRLDNKGDNDETINTRNRRKTLS